MYSSGSCAGQPRGRVEDMRVVRIIESVALDDIIPAPRRAGEGEYCPYLSSKP